MAGEWCEKTGPETPDGHPFNGKRGKATNTREKGSITIRYSVQGHA